MNDLELQIIFIYLNVFVALSFLLIKLYLWLRPKFELVQAFGLKLKDEQEPIFIKEF